MSEMLRRWDGSQWVDVININRIVVQNIVGDVFKFNELAETYDGACYLYMNNEKTFNELTETSGSSIMVNLETNTMFTDFTEVNI